MQKRDADAPRSGKCLRHGVASHDAVKPIQRLIGRFSTVRSQEAGAGDQTRLAIASANEVVLPLPPRSPVSESFASSVATIALRRRVASSGLPM